MKSIFLWISLYVTLIPITYAIMEIIEPVNQNSKAAKFEQTCLALIWPLMWIIGFFYLLFKLIEYVGASFARQIKDIINQK